MKGRAFNVFGRILEKFDCSDSSIISGCLKKQTYVVYTQKQSICL